MDVGRRRKEMGKLPGSCSSLGNSTTSATADLRMVFGDLACLKLVTNYPIRLTIQALGITMAVTIGA